MSWSVGRLAELSVLHTFAELAEISTAMTPDRLGICPQL
jgi:hypothetical protein